MPDGENEIVLGPAKEIEDINIGGWDYTLEIEEGAIKDEANNVSPIGVKNKCDVDNLDPCDDTIVCELLGAY